MQLLSKNSTKKYALETRSRLFSVQKELSPMTCDIKTVKLCLNKHAYFPRYAFTEDSLKTKITWNQFPGHIFYRIFKQKFLFCNNAQTGQILLSDYVYFRSTRPKVFCKKGVLRNFAKFIGKHLCQNLFFNKVAGKGIERHFAENMWLSNTFQGH